MHEIMENYMFGLSYALLIPHQTEDGTSNKRDKLGIDTSNKGDKLRIDTSKKGREVVDAF